MVRFRGRFLSKKNNFNLFIFLNIFKKGNVSEKDDIDLK
jgi:hypothetical protein